MYVERTREEWEELVREEDEQGVYAGGEGQRKRGRVGKGGREDGSGDEKP